MKVMKDIIEIKSKQVPEFKQALMDSKPNLLVEAVFGEMFWGSGLNKEDTLWTKKKYWFGQNKMGQLLSELRQTLLEGYQTVSKSQRRQNQENSQIPMDGHSKHSNANNSDSE